MEVIRDMGVSKLWALNRRAVCVLRKTRSSSSAIADELFGEEGGLVTTASARPACWQAC